MFGHVFEHGVVGRGIERAVVELEAHDLRDSLTTVTAQVDDMPFGGVLAWSSNRSRCSRRWSRSGPTTPVP